VFDKLISIDKRIIAAVSVGATAIVGGGVYFLPYQTLSNMKTATVNRDADALAAEIDFLTLRTNIKAQVKKQIAKLDPNPIDTPDRLKALENVDLRVDKIFTPAGLDQLMQDKIPEVKIDTSMLAQDIAGSEINMGYESLDRFVVHIQDKVDRAKQVSLVLQRSGLDWKLADVNISKL
jgi:Protein of unknown function (DUF2939)